MDHLSLSSERDVLKRIERQEHLLTLTEFCYLARIPIRTVYDMRKTGRAPKMLRHGGRLYVTYRAALAWAETTGNYDFIFRIREWYGEWRASYTCTRVDRARQRVIRRMNLANPSPKAY